MTEKSTHEKILDASRQLFNSRGFAATSLGDIARQVGISKGNLTYHFPTKIDLAIKLRDNTRRTLIDRRECLIPGKVEEDYVAHLMFAMDLTWNNRFLFRDSDEFKKVLEGRDSELMADFEELLELIRRIKQAGMFRKGEGEDLETLTRSIWIVSRYWMDYLREVEGRKEISWLDQKTGIQHHFAVLLPCLTQTARKKFMFALKRLSSS